MHIYVVTFVLSEGIVRANEEDKLRKIRTLQKEKKLAINSEAL